MYYIYGEVVMISLRLSNDMEQKLNRVSKLEKTSKSEIIKKALLMYFEKFANSQSPYELGKDLFGRHGSGNENLSRDYKKILKGKLREKHTR